MNLIEERNQLINRINKSFEKKLAQTCEESSEDDEDVLKCTLLESHTRRNFEAHNEVRAMF